MDLNEIAVFIQVVQSGSFSGAAKALGMPNSTVSHKVSLLEKRLGTSLIQRTTRKLHITPTGQVFFSRCLQGMESFKSAELEISASLGVPQGLLRVTAPIELGGSLLPELISRYQRKYPEVSVEVILTDRNVDLLGEGIDLAIRAGELKDSSLLAKRLGHVSFAAFASPKYLKAKGVPKTPGELREHQLIGFSSLQSLHLVSGKKTAVISFKETRLMINDLNMIKTMAVSGDGVALLPTFLCLLEERTGKLQRVLLDWHSEQRPIHFVYVAQRFIPSQLRAFIDMGSEVLRGRFD